MKVSAPPPDQPVTLPKKPVLPVRPAPTVSNEPLVTRLLASAGAVSDSATAASRYVFMKIEAPESTGKK